MPNKKIPGNNRNSQPSPAKPDRNAAPKKKSTATKSPAKKRWSKDKPGAADTVKKKDPPFGKGYQQTGFGHGNGERAGDGTEGKKNASNEEARPGKSSFKSYRNNRKNGTNASRRKAGPAPGKGIIGAKGEEGRSDAAGRSAKSKGNPKRDAFSKRQLGPAKVSRPKRADEEQLFDSRQSRDSSPARQYKKGGAKPANRAKPAAGKSSARPGGKTHSSKRKK